MDMLSGTVTEVCNEDGFEPSSLDWAYVRGLDFGLDYECPTEPPDWYDDAHREMYLAGLEKAGWIITGRCHQHAIEIAEKAEELEALHMEGGAW